MQSSKVESLVEEPCIVESVLRNRCLGIFVVKSLSWNMLAWCLCCGMLSWSLCRGTFAGG